MLISWVCTSSFSRYVSLIFAKIFGALLNIGIGFSIGSAEEALSSPMGNPAAYAFLTAAGKKGGLAMWVWPILIQFTTGTSDVPSSSGGSHVYPDDNYRHVCNAVRHPYLLRTCS